MDIAGFLSAVGIFVAIILAGREIKHQRKIAAEQTEHERKIAAEQTEHERKIAADRATLDLVVSREIHNPEWSKISATCDSVLSDPKQWGRLFPEERNGERDRTLEMTILTYLNHYEVVAIAIDRRIISEDLYAMWFRNGYVKNWKQAEPFVMHLRRIKKSNTIFDEFKKLAIRWSEINDTNP